MAFDTGAKNAMLDHVGTLIEKVQLFGDEEGGTGTAVAIPDHEAASQLNDINWNSAANAEMSMTEASIEFEVPGGWTVTAISFRNLAGDTQHARDTLAEGDQETYSNDGTYTLTDATLKLENA